MNYKIDRYEKYTFNLPSCPKLTSVLSLIFTRCTTITHEHASIISSLAPSCISCITFKNHSPRAKRASIFKTMWDNCFWITILSTLEISPLCFYLSPSSTMLGKPSQRTTPHQFHYLWFLRNQGTVLGTVLLLAQRGCQSQLLWHS